MKRGFSIGALLLFLLCAFAACMRITPAAPGVYSEAAEAQSGGTDSLPVLSEGSGLPYEKMNANDWLAPVQTEDGLWGYINRAGEWTIEAQYFEAGVFSEGLAAVQTSSEDGEGRLWGYIDARGEFADGLHPWFTSAEAFSDQIARVRDNQSDYVYISRAGELAFPEPILSMQADSGYAPFVNSFSYATDFQNGYAVVAQRDQKADRYRYFVISASGEVLMEFDKQCCENAMYAICFSTPDENGFCILGEPDEEEKIRYGVISLDGEEVLPFLYDEVLPLSQGTFAVSRAGFYGYVSVEGETLIPFVLENATSFYEGVAMVCQQGKWGMINQSGEWVLEPAYEEARGFSEGYAAVKLNGKWGFLNTAGVEVVAPLLEEVGDFSNGLACFSDASGLYGFLNMAGEIVVLPQFRAVGVFGKAEG